MTRFQFLRPVALLCIAICCWLSTSPAQTKIRSNQIPQTDNITFTGQNPLTAYNINGVVYVGGNKYTTLNSAISAICRGSSAEVRLTPGTYNISSSITVPSHCQISGPRTAIVSPASNFGAFVNTGALTDVTLEGFTLQTSGINFSGNSDHITIRNMRLSTTGSTAIAVSGTPGTPGTTQAYITISGNDCESPATYFCIAIGQDNQPNSGSHDWKIENNHMTGCANNCLILQGASRFDVTGNTAQMVPSGDTCLEIGVGMSTGTVTGNTCDMSTANTSSGMVGISTRSAQHVSVTGNTVLGNTVVTTNCFVAWHGNATNETQPEQDVTYVGNTGTNCTIGLKTFQANHFTVVGNHFQTDATAVSIDTTMGGATEWTEAFNDGDPVTVYPVAATSIYFGGSKKGQNSSARVSGSYGNPLLLAPSSNPYISGTTPTISSGFGGSPSILKFNGTAVFTVNVGTGGVATSGVIGFPTAANGWVCQVTDQTTNSKTTFQSANTASSVTVTATAAWAANDILLFQCSAF